MAEKNRRRNYFIKKNFQKRFILRFCALVILGSLISGLILYLFSRGTVTTAFVNSRLSIVGTANYILPALIGSSLIAVVLISIATTFVVMYLCHRIAGPLYKVEMKAQEVGAGDLRLKVTLRSTDEMAKLADCFNKMTENLNHGVSKIKKGATELGEEIDHLTALSRQKGPQTQEAQEALKKISEKKKKLDREIDYFKV